MTSATPLLLLLLAPTCLATVLCDPDADPGDRTVLCQLNLGCIASYCKTNPGDGTQVCQDCGRYMDNNGQLPCADGSATFGDGWCQWACGIGADTDTGAQCLSSTGACKCSDNAVCLPLDPLEPACRRTVQTRNGVVLEDRGNGATGCLNDEECITHTDPASYCKGGGDCQGCDAGTGCCRDPVF